MPGTQNSFSVTDRVMAKLVTKETDMSLDMHCS